MFLICTYTFLRIKQKIAGNLLNIVLELNEMVNYKFLPINPIKPKFQLRGMISTLAHAHTITPAVIIIIITIIIIIKICIIALIQSCSKRALYTTFETIK